MHVFSTTLGYDTPELEQMRNLNDYGISNIREPKELHDAFCNFTSALSFANGKEVSAQSATNRFEESRARRGRAMAVYIGGYSRKEDIIAVANNKKIEPLAELAVSKSITEELLGLEQDQTARGLAESLAQEANPMLVRDTREIMANHAQALSDIAKIITRNQVIENKVQVKKPLSPEERPTITAQQKYYGRDYAHGFAMVGNKPLLIVDNAMHGARSEIMKGGFSSKLHAGFWLGRAAKGFMRTVLHNPSQTAHAFRIIKDVGPTLRSRKSAINAIRKDA